MKELGEYLKQIRISNGVSIEEASDDLNIDSFILENLEAGNIRAFKDVLGIKEKIKSYAKYLGLNPEEVADEFNDFLFEHTSKILLSDILEAEKQRSKEKQAITKKVSSPYTIIKQKKVNKNAIYMCFTIMLLIFIIIFITINMLIPKEEKITNELLDMKVKGDYFEFTK